MAKTWFDLINDLLKASRDGDIVTKTVILQELDEVEPDYADTLDLINY